MERTFRLYCIECKEEYPLSEGRWDCARCGAPLDIESLAPFDVEKIERDIPSLWRYRAFIPIAEGAEIISLGEGMTPLVEDCLYSRKVLLKLEYISPTGSFKDRGTTAMMSRIGELGVEEVVEDSSGNAGASIAAYCARAGVRCHIYAPQSTHPEKLVQIRASGAELHLVPGSRRATEEAALGASEKMYYASHNRHPWFLQGTKTFAFEICEQMGWRAPDAVVIPVGNGSLLYGAYIGFKELVSSGAIGSLPKLIGVQAENCAPLAEAFERGEMEARPIEAKPTLADGISISSPSRGKMILGAVRESGGKILSISESEIEEALIYICGRGFYVEPTSAAAVAGLKRYIEASGEGGTIAVALTGSGLKATDKIGKLL
ncbi:MAG: threonine synthase [bacterium]